MHCGYEFGVGVPEAIWDGIGVHLFIPVRKHGFIKDSGMGR
jgi:hypothetical protein